ncbi:phosphoribosyltransferase family protein [Streptomyces sp. WAC 06725]|uniref:phosphoribosyltransferase family protein n=1 Tax=Streptomyces sp. WAC 06725 TaxID=2203209 RepID=UPI0026A8CBDD
MTTTAEETKETGAVVWTGEWVAQRLGVSLSGGPELSRLLGLALRRNPKRAHLLVSNVLGKHVPQRPEAVHGAGLGLGRRVRELLGDADAARAVVLGYAETATGLGHSVADGLALAPYLHSTRRPVEGVAQAGGFEEEHSHATSHLLLPEDPSLLAGDGPLVLVDDEFSTGRTVLNTIKALHARFPRERYVVVALVDMRSEADRNHLDKFAADLGARVDLISLAAGGVQLPADVLERGQALVAAHLDTAPTEESGVSGTVAASAEGAASGGGPVLGGVAARAGTEARAGAAASGSTAAAVGPTNRPLPERIDLGWPESVPDGGRHGFTPEHRALLEAALPGMAARVADRLAGARRVLVLGNEELMYAPLRLAGVLDDATPAEVCFSTTTRSPVLAVDDPGYAIRTRLTFPAHDRPADGPGERYAYNVAPGTDPRRRFDAIVAVTDSHGDTPELHGPDGLLAQLTAHTDRLLLAVVPSYTPAYALPQTPEPAPQSTPDATQRQV